MLAQLALFKNRLSDSSAQRLFAKKDVAIRILDTVIGNRHLHYAMTGSDTLPTLAFVHGSPGSWSNYRNYMWDDSLLAQFRVISVDRPGFGFSDFGAPLHLDSQARLLGTLFRHLQNGKALILCGHSMGAPVVVQIAIDDPDLVNKLVLVGAPLDVRFERKETWRHIMDVKPLYYALPGAFGPSNTELLYLKTDLLSLQSQFQKIVCDVRFIHGTEDESVPIGSIDLAMATMVNARSISVDTIPGAGHYIPWKNEVVFRQLLSKAAIR